MGSSKPLAHLRRRDLCLVADLLAELQDVAVVVVDGKLAHAVVEVFYRINDLDFVLDLLPQGVNIRGVEVNLSR